MGPLMSFVIYATRMWKTSQFPGVTVVNTHLMIAQRVPIYGLALHAARVHSPTQEVGRDGI